ncbi:ADP-glyceromanno-heptose 6-epimerase [Bacteroidales bacterium OttesenSCG-928-B11]|nr:ADP-glyceromanno-heptose 6-epimerase [Bacteroidales bacterium OttesenSCG-928-B11]MDL2325462.1 ADP-glyceromanno-heptose 6-epimerase [Bacteroidales bacterium OttesenSCG-928-A14]
MIVITGAAGFIGSCMVARLNEAGIEDLILVDDFSNEKKRPNWEHKKYIDKIDRKDFFLWAEKNALHINYVIHLGARTDTTETNYAILEELNLDYSRRLWSFCTYRSIPLLYASSAATYGNGEFGYKDSLETTRKITPLNLYGKSKQEFDLWVSKQSSEPPYWAGFKFFNVYGPNEYHKGRMASVIFHAFNHIKEHGNMNLFRSHNPEFADGEQMRDFIYVKDVTNVLYWFLQKPRQSGIYNLGTGYARPFLALANATFAALKKEPNINFIDIPEDIRDKYQYYTEADMRKLRDAGYRKKARSLEDGTKNYVQKYLANGDIL